MSLLATPEFKVGLMVIVVSGLIGAMSLKVAEGPGLFSGSRKHTFTIENAGGLVKNSAVKMAGIKVGTIEDIQLENGHAKITIALDKNVPLTSSSRIELRTDGILGDRHVEILPGNPQDPPIAKDAPIVSVNESGGLDNLMKEVGKIAKSLHQFTETLNKASQGQGDDSTPVGRIILNIEKVSRDLANITGENREKIAEILDRVKNLTGTLDKYVNSESMEHLSTTLKNVDEITSKINNGQGTVGKLINDDQTVEELNTAIANVNQAIGGFSRWETSVDFHSEYLAQAHGAKSFLALRLQPGLDRYYEIQVIDDARGYTSIVDTTVTPKGGPPTNTETQTTFRNKLKITGLFAKNFYDFTLKGGLIESSGGFGIDYHLLNRKLRLSVEAFDFANLDIRAFARYNFFKGFYVTAGVDNALNKDQQFSSFIGAGLFITNDDLKVLATRLSF